MLLLRVQYVRRAYITAARTILAESVYYFNRFFRLGGRTSSGRDGSHFGRVLHHGPRGDGRGPICARNGLGSQFPLDKLTSVNILVVFKTLFRLEGRNPIVV